MAELLTNIQIEALGDEFLMGHVWESATPESRVKAVNSAEALWKTFRWAQLGSPFDNPAVARNVEGVLAWTAKHMLIGDGQLVEEDYNELQIRLKPWLGRRMVGITGSLTVEPSGDVGGPGVDNLARTTAETALQLANLNANKLMPPSGAEADNASATTIRGWSAAFIRRVVESIVPAWARQSDAPAGGSALSTAQIAKLAGITVNNETSQRISADNEQVASINSNAAITSRHTQQIADANTDIQNNATDITAVEQIANSNRQGLASVTGDVEGLKDVQSITISTAGSYISTMVSQHTSKKPLILVVEAEIRGNLPSSLGSHAFVHQKNQVLWYNPLDTTGEPLFILPDASAGGGGAATATGFSIKSITAVSINKHTNWVDSGLRIPSSGLMAVRNVGRDPQWIIFGVDKLPASVVTAGQDSANRGIFGGFVIVGYTATSDFEIRLGKLANGNLAVSMSISITGGGVDVGIIESGADDESSVDLSPYRTAVAQDVIDTRATNGILLARQEARTADGKAVVAQDQVAAEAVVRAADDVALGKRIDGEAADRMAADTALGARIESTLRRTQRIRPISQYKQAGGAQTLLLEWKPVGAVANGAAITVNVGGVNIAGVTAPEGLNAEDINGTVLSIPINAANSGSIDRSSNTIAGHVEVQITHGGLTDTTWVGLAPATTAAPVTGNQLPDFPAEGSRNDKIPKFDGDVLKWEPDAGTSTGGGTPTPPRELEVLAAPVPVIATSGVDAQVLPANYDEYDNYEILVTTTENVVTVLRGRTAFLKAQTDGAATKIGVSDEAESGSRNWLTWTPSTRTLGRGGQGTIVSKIVSVRLYDDGSASSGGASTGGGNASFSKAGSWDFLPVGQVDYTPGILKATDIVLEDNTIYAVAWKSDPSEFDRFGQEFLLDLSLLRVAVDADVAQPRTDPSVFHAFGTANDNLRVAKTSDNKMLVSSTMGETGTFSLWKIASVS